MDLIPTTELDAVNIILENDGEAPVAALDDSGFSEAGAAQRVLREISRQVQTEGHAFNIDYERKFTPDVSDEIALPTNTLWVQPTYISQEMSIVERGRKLYDLEDNSYTFTSPVYLNVCQMLDWTDLPSAARDYITVRAARVYQSRSTGSTQQNSFTESDEMRYEATFRRANNRSRKRGFFRNSSNARLTLRRPL